MFSSELKTEIDAYAARLMGGARLWQLAERGEVSPSAVGSYLSSLRYLITFTEPFLALARARSTELGRGALAAFFGEKLPEEHGHDVWAEQDLARLKMRFRVETELAPKPAIVRLVQLLEAAIRQNPASYLGYMTFTEYFTVVAGPSWIRLLAERCDVPESMLSVISRHVELDREHAARGFAELDQLTSGADAHDVSSTVRSAMGCLEGFYDQLADESRDHPGRERRDDAA